MWYNKKATKRDKKLATEFLSIFDVKVVRWNKTTGWASKNGEVALIDDCELYIFWSIVFHELCHILNGREGKFKTYHLNYDNRTKKNIRTIRRIAWNAEKYTDERAKKLMKIYFPDIPYWRSYKTKKQFELFKKEWLNKYYPL